MGNIKLYVNYRLLWREVQECNRFEASYSRLLRRGNSYVLYTLCNQYKDLLNKLIQKGEGIDPNHLPIMYVASSEMYLDSPFQMKSITNCLNNLNSISFKHLIQIQNIFNESKFMVTIPLRYFYSLKRMSSNAENFIE